MSTSNGNDESAVPRTRNLTKRRRESEGGVFESEDSDFFLHDYELSLKSLDPIPCDCEKEFESGSLRSIPTDYCQAKDEIDDDVFGCSRLADVSKRYRVSPTVEYLYLCDYHIKRLKNHECCPRCGKFCTQGQFFTCVPMKPNYHLFHVHCAVSSDDKEDFGPCPHCTVSCEPESVKIELVSDSDLLLILPPDIEKNDLVKSGIRSDAAVKISLCSTPLTEQKVKSVVSPEPESRIFAREKFLNSLFESLGLKKEIPNVKCDDVSRGRESIPIQCIGQTEVLAPLDFIYTTSVVPIPGTRFEPRNKESSCSCKGPCLADCWCQKLSMCERYDDDGRLVDLHYGIAMMIMECGPLCTCDPELCKNRVTQKGITHQLEVFESTCGWGVRTLEPIDKGAFVCEYVGELITDADAELSKDDSYLYELSKLGDGGAYCIDAKRIGNVARFINHFCNPNLIMYNVLYDHQDRRFAHLALFALKDIPEGTELGYDYGLAFWKHMAKRFYCKCDFVNCKYKAGKAEETLKAHCELE